MKQFFITVSIVLLMICAVSGVISCKSPPPPAPPPQPESPPPPPPPDPPPEPPAPDTAGPELEVSFSSEYFSPDGDGVEDELTVSIKARDESPIQNWRIEIREPYPPHLLFSEWSGDGPPPEQIVWDGRSVSGELVQSATDYPFKITVTDAFGNSSVYEGVIQVDVLVIREAGGVLRVQVPSIVFASDSGSLDGLNAETTANNDWILTRIAQVLNKFNTYKVKIEGHANPTTPPNTAARRTEEAGTNRIKGLLPLSEERAKSVVEYLVKLGVDRGRLTAIGVGSARTIVDFADKDNWWKNRRVEFILVK
jgi:outer membrane protein OmpA-like peptidoglycan-associated protein